MAIELGDVMRRIDAEEARVEAAHRAEQLRIFRMRLQLHVTWMSPFVRDLADASQIGLEGLADMLRPHPLLGKCSALLPPRRQSLRPAKGVAGRKSPNSPWSRESDRLVAYSMSRKGVILRTRPNSGQLGFMVSGAHLLAAGWLGECWFHTDSDVSHIVMRGEVPETLIAASVGRKIGQIISHPTLDGRDYPVTRAVRIYEEPAVAFTFWTGIVPFEMPWADLLDGMVDEPSSEV